MRVAVTGANGFIGRHLVQELAGAGHYVVTISRQEAPPPGASFHRTGDVSMADTWRAMEGADAVVHLAGLSDASLSRGRPVEYNAVNAVGTLLGLEAARRQNSLFVLASTQRVYRSSLTPVAEDSALEPVDPYGYSKLVAETWLAMYRRLFDLPAVIVRLFSVYGPGQMAGKGASGVVALFTTRALRDEPLVVHDQSCRDFTYAGDVVRGLRMLLEAPQPVGDLYNLATGVATTTESLARLVVAVTGSRSEISAENREKLGESYVADIAKAQRELGYRPTVMLREGLERYAEWLRGRR